MNLKDFVENYICPNSVIRLWKPLEGSGHEMLKLKEEYSDITMEWKLLNGEAWQSMYNDCEVIGIKDIVVDGFYREAINIVIKV